MNPNPVFLEPQTPIWAGAGRLYEIQALSPTHREVCGFSVFSNVSDVFSVSEYTSKAKGLVSTTKPREVGNGLPDLSSNTELGGDKKW